MLFLQGKPLSLLLVPYITPDKHSVTFQDRQAYKQILLQSNARRVNYSTSGETQAINSLKYARFVSKMFNEKNEEPWEWVQ